MSYPSKPGDSPFAPPPYHQPGYQQPTNMGEPPRAPGSSGCLWGCIIAGIAGLIIVLICAGTVYYVTKNIKTIAVNFARTIAVQAIEGSELTAEDKQQVIAQIDRVVEAYNKGDINEQDLENILTEVSDSPLLPLAVVYGIDQKYLQKSGLTPEEKTDARRQLQRLVRGGMEKKIPQEKIDKLLEPLQVTDAEGETQLKDQLTDEEIKTFINGAKQLADEALIPDEEYTIDIGAEVKRIVDRGLEKGEH